uniref:Acyl-CoA dehydrogenase family member 11-like n=1 Tax=Pogona vitticeps TaxID=103695 RepID=A0ABM5F2B2_9SAUR
MAADGQVEQGSKGLSLFYLKVRDAEGKLNKIEIHRLKDKLGTRQLLTAELFLDGAKALRISAEGQGVATIAHMLTIARIHNAIGAVAFMRRMIHMARDYATKREAFGKLLKDHPLHTQTLARMEVQTRGAFLLSMEMGRLLGLEETEKATVQDQHMLRLLTPVVKLYTGKQVLTIWEGTTNILSLDVLRSIVKSGGKVLDAFFSMAQAKLEVALGAPELELSVQIVQKALHKLRLFTQEMGLKGEEGMQLSARDFAYTLARIYGGVLLLEHAARPRASATDIFTAQRWCQQDLCLVDREDKAGSYSTAAVSLDHTLVFGGYPFVRGKL